MKIYTVARTFCDGYFCNATETVIKYFEDEATAVKAMHDDFDSLMKEYEARFDFEAFYRNSFKRDNNQRCHFSARLSNNVRHSITWTLKSHDINGDWEYVSSI